MEYDAVGMGKFFLSIGVLTVAGIQVTFRSFRISCIFPMVFEKYSKKFRKARKITVGSPYTRI